MYQLSFWSPQDATRAGMERIYVNGEDVIGKAYFMRSRGHIVLTCDEATQECEILDEVCAQFQVDFGAPDAWDRLKAACAPARGRSAAPAASGRGTATRSTTLDFTTKFVVPEGPVVIEIDHREPEEFDRILRAVPNVTVERKQLALGDFVINRKNIWIERKTVADFEASIVDDDKRLFNQIERMGFQDNALAFVVIAGNLHAQASRMDTPGILGALSYLSAIKGVSLIPTTDLEMTAYFALKVARHDAFGLGYNLALRATKPKAMLDARRFVLEGLPGVSAGLAEKLLEHFGSVRAVIAASREQLLGVPGLGAKTADRIIALVDA